MCAQISFYNLGERGVDANGYNEWVDFNVNDAKWTGAVVEATGEGSEVIDGPTV